MSMIGDEIDWLHNFEPGDSEDISLSDTDNRLVAGHLHLIRTLLTCEGVDKRKIGMNRRARVCMLVLVHACIWFTLQCRYYYLVCLLHAAINLQQLVR